MDAVAASPAPVSRFEQFLIRSEPWLPLLAGVAWWAAMYPGLFGEDSLMNLAEARDGPVSVWFTAWWIYLIRFVTLGGRAIPLLTLFGVVALAFAARYWAAACLPRGAARALAVCLVCASPLVGALGIQVRHDVEMTAGLLLCAAVVTRLHERTWPRIADLLVLAAAVVLIATRHNGIAAVLGAGLGCVLIPGAGLVRQGLMLLTVAAAVLVGTIVVTRVAGHREIADRLGAVEWAITDISCLLSKDDVRVSADDWTYLNTVATRTDWPQPNACRFMDKELFASSSFKPSVVRGDPGALLKTWLALAIENPSQMLRAHAERVRLFLPPFVGGLPRTDNLPFIHSTILTNTFDLEWAFPRVAGAVRLFARAWNAVAIVVANAGLWLIALLLSARALGDRGRAMFPTIFMAIALELGILVAAPMSEGRYGLFILIVGQIAALTVLFDYGFKTDGESAFRRT
jgi:hypothetical protein